MMKIKLPELPYAFDALEPNISKKTLEVHYTKHHQHYVDKTNELIRGTHFEHLEDLNEIIIESSRKKEDKEIFNNASQAWNHQFFWNCLRGGQKRGPSAELTQILGDAFGSYKEFSDKFKNSALQLFGSGWVWLVRDDKGDLEILPLKDGDSPLIYEKTPLLVCDVWEHAYYLDYQSERNKYLENFWKVIDWSYVENTLNQNKLNPEGKVLLKKDILDRIAGPLFPDYN